MRQHGFTIVEIAVATVLVGILALAMAPALPEIAAAVGNRQEARQRVVNQRIANGFVNLARETQSIFGLGVPLAVYNSAGFGDPYFYAPVNPGNAGWVPVPQYLAAEGVAGSEIAGDGTVVDNARVFQLASPLTKTFNLYGTGGPQISIVYQFGVIYTSNCSRADTSCYAPTLIPGGGTALTTANYTTWTPPAMAVAPVFFSTLPGQMERVKRTADGVDILRDAFRRYYRAQQLLAPTGNSTTNFFPTGNCLSPCSVAATPTLNQGCYDGWYPLDTGDVLPKLGLSPTYVENAKTGFNSVIDYCRDFHPASGTYTKAQGAKPNWGALRFRKDLTNSALISDRATGVNSSALNVVITF